jgi:DNA polymerase III subunit delta
MTFESLMKDLNAGKYHPLYFLFGEEPYFIDQVSDFIEKNALTEAEKSFNQVILYGKETEFKTIVDEARQFPMMASRRVIIVKEAQEMKTLPELISYIEKPSPSSILVLCHKYKKLDKRTKIAKILDEKAVVFESKKMYDNQVAPWIREFLKSKGLTSETGVPDIIAEYLGADLSKISNELNKMLLNFTTHKTITLIDVKEQIGISKDFDVFELQRVLGEKNFVKAAMIINYFKENPTANPAVMVISSLFTYFNKVMIAKSHASLSDQDLSRQTGVNPFFLKEYRNAAKNYSMSQLIKIFRVLKTADKNSKGIESRRSDDGAIFKDILIGCMFA